MTFMYVVLDQHNYGTTVVGLTTTPEKALDLVRQWDEKYDRPDLTWEWAWTGDGRPYLGFTGELPDDGSSYLSLTLTEWQEQDITIRLMKYEVKE